MLYSGPVGYQTLEQATANQARVRWEPLSVCDDEQLLTGVRQLDPDVLAQAHDCFYDAIYRYARYRTGDDQVAEDAASEVFVRLLDAVQANKAPRTSLRGWLFGTASHVVNDHLRNHYRAKDEDLGNHEALLASQETNPEHRFQQNVSHRRLRTALTQLTPEQQHVIALRFGRGLSHREVAKMISKSEGAAKLLQFRALKALRRLLDEPV
jgi:RNA polymerase sigma-70 factor (ECF subfamily)